MARGVKFVRWDLEHLIEQVRSVCVVSNDGKDCWLWAYGGSTTEWYPEIMIKRRKKYVSRWLLEITTGTTGPVARHKCDRMRCCNPGHLEWGTQADNVRDSFERGNRTPRKPRKPRRVNRPHELARGERHGLARLTEEQVIAIRERHATGSVSVYRLAKDYGVAQCTITNIVRRKTWTHVPG